MENDHTSSRRRITAQGLNEESDAINQNATRQQGKYRSSQIAADLHRRRAALVNAGVMEADSGQPIEQMSARDHAILDAKYRALEQSKEALPSAPMQGPTRTGQALDTPRPMSRAEALMKKSNDNEAAFNGMRAKQDKEFYTNLNQLPKEDRDAVLQLATRGLKKNEGTKLVDPVQEERIAMERNTAPTGAGISYRKGAETGRGDGTDPNYQPGKTLGKVVTGGKYQEGIASSTFTNAQSDAYDTKPVVNQGPPQQRTNLPMADQQKIMTEFPDIARAGTKANEIFVADYKKSNNPAEAMDIARNATEAAAMDDPKGNAATDALEGMKYDKQNAIKAAAAKLNPNATTDAPVARGSTMKDRLARVQAPKPASPAPLNTGQEIGKTITELPGKVSNPIAEGFDRGATFIDNVAAGITGGEPATPKWDALTQPPPSPEYTAIKQQRAAMNAAPIAQPQPLKNIAQPNMTPKGQPGSAGVPQAGVNPSANLSQPATSAVPNSPATVPSLDEEARKKALAGNKPLQFNFA